MSLTMAWYEVLSLIVFWFFIGALVGRLFNRKPHYTYWEDYNADEMPICSTEGDIIVDVNTNDSAKQVSKKVSKALNRIPPCS